MTAGSVLFRDVLLWDPTDPEGMTGPTDLLVADGRIAAIGSSARSALEIERVVDGAGHHVLLPGLINAHFHSPANHLKGSLPSLPLELFMLFESPADPELTPTPREAYLRTMLAVIEMLKTGTTSVQDDAFVMPAPTPEIVDAIMQAYADSGIRATVALDQPELSETQKLPPYPGLPDDPAPVDAADLLAAYDHLISRWHGAADDRLRAAVSISAPQRVSPEYFEALDELSRRHDLPLFAHMLETRVQRTLAGAQPRFAGRSLVRYTADLGLLSDRVNVIHAVWVDDDDLRLIAGAGAVIAHNPVSNLRLGSGIAPFRAFRRHGIPVALGSDEAICDDSANLWGVVKAAGLVHNVTGLDSDDWPTAHEVLDALWTGGAAAMRRSGELGVIREGALADLAMLDLWTTAFTPLSSLPGQLVYCEYGQSVRLTMVAGRIVAEGGRVVSVDEDALLAEAREAFAAKLPAVRRARARASELLPAYQGMVRASAGVDVGMTRWAESA
jgi:cytosine/adenosine deaminase-related metal-dependent hydrolase